MALLRAEGVVLRLRDLGDTSRLVTVYTREQGRLTLVAKGARTPRNRFGAALLPGAHVSIVFYQRETRDLRFLSHADLLTPPSAWRGDLETLTYTGAVCELLDTVIVGEEKQSALYALTLEMLDVLSGRTPPEIQVSPAEGGIASCTREAARGRGAELARDAARVGDPGRSADLARDTARTLPSGVEAFVREGLEAGVADERAQTFATEDAHAGEGVDLAAVARARGAGEQSFAPAPQERDTTSVSRSNLLPITPARREAWLLAFQLRLAILLGLSPELRYCVACRAPVPPAARFAARRGGVLCERCGERETESFAVSAGALASLRLLGVGTLAALPPLPPPIGSEVETVLEVFLRCHVQHYTGLKARHMLRRLAELPGGRPE
jgi:recombinational DNA repair protein (RecF pathway)